MNECWTYLVKITGTVQGVGFRPFIYCLAKEKEVSGWVKNTNEGVTILITILPEKLQEFIDEIKQKCPAVASITSISYEETDNEPMDGFRIIESTNTTNKVTNISPDIAVCNECISDMLSQPHRINYPLINCTNCGPRFSIIKNIPYDRPNTTMECFEMCDTCLQEYQDIYNRRFHAQPVACNSCGPIYSLNTNTETITDINTIIDKTATLIDNGSIVAIKGIGGYFIVCNATNKNTVEQLRKKKIRDGKPFAVMFRNISTIKKYCHLNITEEELLASWQAPVVLLEQKEKLPESINSGLNTIGALLPYMPVHYMIFERTKTDAIVFTSGNISEEPIIINDDKALKIFLNISDAVIINNREIYNRTDDSVMFVCNEKSRFIRRSRGYVPSVIETGTNIDGILACGAEFTNTFCIGKDTQAIMSQHIGDLKNYETYEFYEESINRFKNLFRMSPTLLACDMHPDYLSTQFAVESGLPLVKVQHHHAHIVSCMSENMISNKVIGVAMDGTGYGDDGNTWGGEFLICDRKDYTRVSHFDYIPIPGGDKATSQIWRTALSYLYKIYGDDIININIPFIKEIERNYSDIILDSINKNINAPLSSSAGRLFDAVAGITGLCHEAKYHAEAPMLLESVIDKSVVDSYSIEKIYEQEIIKPDTLFRQITTDIQKHIPVSVISSKFHNSFVNILYEKTIVLSEKHNIKDVVLSGGTFQNKYISEQLETRLQHKGFNVYVQQKVPANDGGIALGQIIVAANKI